MAKKIKPSLKGYLSTGKRAVGESGKKPEQTATTPEPRSDAFLDLLAPSDFKMWESMLGAGTTVQLRRLDIASIREDFQAMDVNRFTCYTLAKKGEPLRPVRSGSQIDDPLALLLKWDETGILTVYDPSV